jgi:carboxymethylenebutenolidase
MKSLKKEDVKQEVFDLYDDYAHNRINRRDFMQKLSVYAVGGITVTSLMSFLMPD